MVYQKSRPGTPQGLTAGCCHCALKAVFQWPLSQSMALGVKKHVGKLIVFAIRVKTHSEITTFWDFMSKNRIDHNSNDFISISDINTTDRYRILLRFSWYGLEMIFIKCIYIKTSFFENKIISKNRILLIQKSFDVAAALPRPHYNIKKSLNFIRYL